MPTIAQERQIYADLLVGRPDGVTWESLREYLASATVELGDISGIGTGQSGVDGVVRRMTFTLRNDRADMPGDSFSPRDRNSAWNRFDVDGDGAPEYAPLLWPNREVMLQVRVMGNKATTTGEILAVGDGVQTAFATNHAPLINGFASIQFGMSRRWSDFTDTTWADADFAWNTLFEPADEVGYSLDHETGAVTFDAPLAEGVTVVVGYAYWTEDTGWIALFHGLLGDAIRTSGPVVVCETRDLAKRLQDAYILPEMVRPYDSAVAIPAEELMQNLLDDVLGRRQVTLYFPGGTEDDPRPISESPGWMIYPKAEIWEFKSLWDALQFIASQFGWFLGYRWHKNTRRMQLILMEPPREKDAATADFHLSWKDDVYSALLEITDRDVRNIIVGTFWNRDTEQRVTMMVRDEDSIAEFGPRAAQIDEGETSLIDTPEEMERLLLAALHDLKDLSGTTQIEMPLLPEMDVFAGIVLDDPRVSSEPLFYGVESVRHTLDFEAGRFRTEIVGAGRVIGSRVRWLQMQTRPGVRQPPKTITLFPPEQVTATAEEQGGDTVIRVEWTPRPNAITYLVQWWPEGSEEFRSARVSGSEYVIADLPQGAIPWPSPTLYPSVDLYPMPAVYQVGVAMISDFGRISELNVVSVDMGI